MPEEHKIRLSGTPEQIAEMLPQIIAIYQLLETKDIGTVYADSSDVPPVHRKGKPKVTLYFREDTDFRRTGVRTAMPHGRNRTEGTISFRLMEETTATLSRANAVSLGRKIKDLFGTTEGYVWKKGKTMYSYTDWDKGYQFQLLCRSKIESKRIITDVLSLQSHTPDWRRLREIEPDDELASYPAGTRTRTVLGETVTVQEERPVVDVRFQYSYLTVDGANKPFTLYDRRKKLPEPIVI